MEGQVPVFISVRNWVALLYPRALGYKAQVFIYSLICVMMDS
jgi:hypothetical protein